METQDIDYTLYKKYKTEEQSLETITSPMSPGHFYNLSQVQKFNEVNGYTYDEYINIWKKRYNILDIDYITVVAIHNNGKFKTTLLKKAFIDNSGHIRLPTHFITKGVYERITGKNYDDLPTL
jgi:hypothetical protein